MVVQLATACAAASFAVAFWALGGLKRFADEKPFDGEPKGPEDSALFESYTSVRRALLVSFLLLMGQYAAMLAFGAAGAVPYPAAVVALQAALLVGSARLRASAFDAVLRDRSGRRLLHLYSGSATVAEKQGPLVRSGPYARVRHPFYTSHMMHYAGVYLFAAAASLASRGPLMTLCLVVHAVAVSRFARHLTSSAAREEKALAEKTPAYAEYRARVRARFVPFLW